MTLNNLYKRLGKLFEARLKYCGMAGRAKIAKELRQLIADRDTPAPREDAGQ